MAAIAQFPASPDEASVAAQGPGSPGGETQAHRDLKRLALVWAQANGYRIAAAEVSLPNYRVRMDVAACRMERMREARGRGGRAISRATIGATAIFECKASAADFVRDARSSKRIQEKLQSLDARRLRAEEELKIHYPSIRNGDSLFQEFETLDFQRPGYERYEKIIREIGQFTARLHANTKFDRLTKSGAANLFYVVAEPGMVTSADLPSGWGLLERTDDILVVKAKPHWHDVREDERLAFLQRIALAGTRCVNREHGVAFVPQTYRGETSNTQHPTSNQLRAYIGKRRRGRVAGPHAK